LSQRDRLLTLNPEDQNAIASYRENKNAIAKRYCVVSDQILELISSFFEKFNYNIVQ
jgi:hypothetical protein